MIWKYVPFIGEGTGYYEWDTNNLWQLNANFYSDLSLFNLVTLVIL